MQSKAKILYSVSVLLQGENCEMWLKPFTNHMAKLTPTSADTFTKMSGEEQPTLLKSLFGTRIKITATISKQSNFTNVSIISLNIAP